MTMIVINLIKTVNALLVRVNVYLIMYWILKPRFVIKLLRYRVTVSLIVVKINSVLMVCANVNQAMNTINFKTFVIENCVISTAIVIHLIRIVSVLEINVSVDPDMLWIQVLRSANLQSKSHALRLMIAVLINSVLKIYANVNQTMFSMIQSIYVNSNLVIMTAIVIHLIRIVSVLDMNVSVNPDMLWIQILRSANLQLKSHAVREMIAVLINSVLKIYANVNQIMFSMIQLIYVNSNLVIMTMIAIKSIAIGFVKPITECVTAVKLTIK
jgi:hypothetical protein